MGKRDREKRKNRNKREFQGDRLNKRIKKGQEKANFRNPVLKEFDRPLWSPSFDDHTIDVIPYYAGNNDVDVDEGEETYTYEYLVHKKVGAQNTWIVCPGMYDKPCPICEYRNKLREKDDKKYKNYWPRPRNLYNIICHDSNKELKKGVQIWDVPKFWFEEPLMKISKRPARRGKEEKTINFAHPSKKIGKSIAFTIDKPKSDKDYPHYGGHAFNDRDYNVDKDILDQALILDEIVEVKSYKEIEKLFYGSDGKPSNNKNDDSDPDDNENIDFEELLDDLDDLDDNDDLEEFIDDNNLDDYDIEIDEDKSFKKNLKSVKKSLKKLIEEKENEEDDEQETSKSSEYDRDDIDDMSYKKLKKLIKKENLDIDLKDYDEDDKKDIEELRDDICEELGIDDE